ncbi:MAG: HPr family phosphocarrier protein, partial [Spirochaetia bacterium]
STILLQKDHETINAKSIMGIITLGAGYETELTIRAEGPDEAEAVDALYSLFESKFEEE